ncbi:MAG: carbon-nitrogen hydrolase family protein [Pseudomonadota bacterium]
MSEPTFVAACVQLTSKADVAANMATCQRLCAQARCRGAELVVLPENFAFMGETEREKLAIAESLGKGPLCQTLAEIATKQGIWLIAGGLPERSDVDGKVYNTLVAFSPDGRIAASYRKIHLFDVHIPGGAYFRESGTVVGGKDPVVLDSPWGRIGLSICYDLRFPELYRVLVDQGAKMVVVPAAFTLHTGKDHWHVLLRARAVENEIYVLAAGQFGRHNEKRMTYGHSVIVDPWGVVLAEAPDRECVITTTIDLAYLEEVRRELPCLDHRRVGASDALNSTT